MEEWWVSFERVNQAEPPEKVVHPKEWGGTCFVRSQEKINLG